MLYQKKKIPTSVGTLVSEDFTTMSNLNNYVIVKPDPTTTIGLSGGYLRLATTTLVGGSSNYIYFNNYLNSTDGTVIENYTLTVDFIWRAATTYNIISIGTKSVGVINPYSYQFLLLTDTISAKILRSYVNGTQFGGDGTGTFIIPAINDTIRLIITRAANVFNLSVTNLTQGGTNTNSLTLATNNPATAPIAPDISKLCIWSGSGISDVKSLTFTSTANKNANVIMDGDSITQWYASSALSNRYPAQLMSGSSKTYVVLAGQGERTAELLNRLNEIITLAPRWIILAHGSNDIGTGVSVSTAVANLQTAATTLRRSGIGIIIGIECARNDVSLAALRTAIIAAFPNDYIIDFYTTTVGTGSNLNPTYAYTDGVHLIDAGMSAMATAAKSQAPQIYY